MKNSLMILAVILASTVCAVAQNNDKPADKPTGVFDCQTSGHSDWIDNQKVSYDSQGRAHVSGDWEAPTGVREVCTLLVGSTIYVVDGTPDAKSNSGYIPSDKPVPFRAVLMSPRLRRSRLLENEKTGALPDRSTRL